MSNFLNINFEFSKEKAISRLEDVIQENKAGYICVVDTNIAVRVDRDKEYYKTINNSLFNICDSSWIPVFYNLKTGANVSDYKGPDFFLDVISKKKYISFFLGSSDEVLRALKDKIVAKDSRIQDMTFYSPPFLSVEQFDYKHISDIINNLDCDIVWVALGAPKQEKFMERLLPYLNKAVCIGVGAAFTLNSEYNKYRRAPIFIQALKLEWVYRIYLEPKKQGRRILSILFFFPILVIKHLFK